MKDQQCIDFAGKIAPHGISARDMPMQCAERRGLGIELKRNMIRVQNAGTERHQRGERPLADQLMQNFDPLLFKM